MIPIGSSVKNAEIEGLIVGIHPFIDYKYDIQSYDDPPIVKSFNESELGQVPLEAVQLSRVEIGVRLIKAGLSVLFKPFVKE